MSGGRNVEKAKTGKMSNVTIACAALSALFWGLYLLFIEKGKDFKAKKKDFLHI